MSVMVCDCCGAEINPNITECNVCGAHYNGKGKLTSAPNNNSNVSGGGSDAGGGGGGGGNTFNEKDILKSSDSNARYPSLKGYDGIDINFEVAVSALFGIKDLMSSMSTAGSKFGHVDFSKVKEVSDAELITKTKCLAGTFGSGSDSVLADMYSNFCNSLDQAAASIPGLNIENFSEMLLTANDAATQAYEDYKNALGEFGAIENAEGYGTFLQALASISDKTEIITTKDGRQACLVTSRTGQIYQIEFDGNQISSIGLLGSTLIDFSNSTSYSIELTNALNAIDDNTIFTLNEDGSKEYHIMDTNGNSYVVQKDAEGNVISVGEMYSEKTFSYIGGLLSGVTYSDKDGTVTMKSEHDKGSTSIYMLNEESGELEYNTDFQKDYKRSVIGDLAEKYYLMESGQEKDLLEDFEISYLERISADVDKAVEIRGRDGIEDYQKTFLYFKDELIREEQIKTSGVEIANANQVKLEAQSDYEKALANYNELKEKYDMAISHVFVREEDEAIIKEFEDAELALNNAKDRLDLKTKEYDATVERFDSMRMNIIGFETARDCVTSTGFDDEKYFNSLNNNQEYQDLRVKTDGYWENFYKDLASDANEKATEYSREKAKAMRFQFVDVILDGSPETQAEYERQMARFNQYCDEVVAPIESQVSKWKGDAATFSDMEKRYATDAMQAMKVMPDNSKYSRESMVANFKDQLDFTQIGDGVTGTIRVFYDKDGNEVTSNEEISIYCIQNGIDASTAKSFHSKEYKTNLEAISDIKNAKFRPKGLDGNTAYFTTEDAINTYFYASEKYGDEKAKDVFTYFNNMGANLIGGVESENRIEEIRLAYNNRNSDNKKTLAALGRFTSVVGDALKHGLEGWVQNFAEFFDGDGRMSAHDYEVQNYMEHLSSDNDFAKAYYSNIYEINSSIGNMLPTIALSLITGGMANAAGLAGEVVLDAAGNAVLDAAGNAVRTGVILSKAGEKALTFCSTFASMGISAAGGTKEQAMQAGMDENTATFYGLLSGLSETGMEMILGALPGIGQMEEVFNKLGGMNAVFGKMLSEGIEESTQEVVDAALSSFFTGEKFYVDSDAVLKSGIYGAITSGILSGAEGVENVALKAGNIATNIVIDGIVHSTTTTPTGIDYLLNKYSGMSLTQALTSQELKSDLLHLNGVRSSLDSRVTELMGDADFQETYRLYSSETADPLSMKEYANITAVEDIVKDSRLSNTVGQTIAGKIDQRNELMQRQGVLREEIAEIRDKLGVGQEETIDFRDTTNEKTDKKKAKLIADLFTKTLEYQMNSQIIDKNGIDIFDQYSVERDNLAKLRSELESNPASNTLDNREKARDLERKVKAYETYVSDVIAQKLTVNENYDVAETNYNYYARERAEKSNAVAQNEARINELQTKLDELNKTRKESKSIDSVLASDIETVRNEMNELRQKNDALNDRINVLDGRINSTIATMQKYKGDDISKIGKAQELLAADLDSKRDELDNLKEKISGLRSQGFDTSNNEELRSMVEESQRLTQEINNIQKTINDNNARLSEIDSRIIPINSVVEESTNQTSPESESLVGEAANEVLSAAKDGLKDGLSDEEEEATARPVEKISGDEIVVAQEELVKDTNKENAEEVIQKATRSNDEEQGKGFLFGRKKKDNKVENKNDVLNESIPYTYYARELDEDALEYYKAGKTVVDYGVKVDVSDLDASEASKFKIRRSEARSKDGFLKLVPGEKVGFDFSVMELNRDQIIAEGDRVLNSEFPNGKTGWQILYENGLDRSITTFEELAKNNGELVDVKNNDIFVIGPNGYEDIARKLTASWFRSSSWGSEAYNYIFGDNSLLLFFATGNYSAIEKALKIRKRIYCTADSFGKYTALEISTLENALYNLGYECEFIPKKVTATNPDGTTYETVLYQLKTKRITKTSEETIANIGKNTVPKINFNQMTHDQILEHFIETTDEKQLARDIEDFVKSDNYDKSIFRAIRRVKEENVKLINAITNIKDESIISKLREDEIISISSYENLSNETLEFLAKNNLVTVYDIVDFTEEIKKRNLDIDYKEYFNTIGGKKLSMLLYDLGSSDIIDKLFAELPFDALDVVMSNLGNDSKKIFLSSVAPDYLNYYIREVNSDYELMKEFADKLDTDNLMSYVSKSDKTVYEELSIEQLSKLISSGDKSFIDYISNNKLGGLYLKTKDSSLLEVLNSSVKRQMDIRFDLKRSDGTTVSIELKNVIEANDKTIFVYEIDGKQFFSMTNIIEKIINENESRKIIANDYLADYRLAHNSYLGEIENGSISYSNADDKMVVNAVNAYINSSEDFFDHMRDGNTGLKYGADQTIRSTANGRRYIDSLDGSVDEINSESYKRLVDYFGSKYNMSEETVAEVISYVIDYRSGACSYADIVNKIFDYYKDYSIEFKKAFGFDMYEFENGKKILNSRMLLMDIFIRCNSSDLSPNGKIFSIDEKTGERVINNITDKEGNVRKADDREQIFMSSSLGYSKDAINYFKSMGIDIEVENHLNGVDFEQVKELARKALLEGRAVAISEYSKRTEVDDMGQKLKVTDPTQKNLVFHNLDGERDTSILNWHEGGGHVTHIVGMTEDSFIVISWGQKHEIKFSDLAAGNYDLDIIKMSSQEVRNAKTDTQIYEELATLSAEELYERIDSFDFDYVVKNYISDETLKDLSKLMTPQEMLSRTRSSLAINYVYFAYGPSQVETLTSSLTMEQRLMCIRNGFIPSESILDGLTNIYEITSNIDVLTEYTNYYLRNASTMEECQLLLQDFSDNNLPLYVEYVFNNMDLITRKMGNAEFYSIIREMTKEENYPLFSEFLNNNRSRKVRNSLVSKIISAVNSYGGDIRPILITYARADFDSFADYMKNNMGVEAYNEFINNCTFKELYYIYSYNESELLLEELVLRSDRRTSLFTQIDFGDLLRFVSRKTTEELNDIKSRVSPSDALIIDNAINALNKISDNKFIKEVKDILLGYKGDWLELTQLLNSKGMLSEENIIKMIKAKDLLYTNKTLLNVILVASINKPSCVMELSNYINNNSKHEVYNLMNVMEQSLTNKAKTTLVSQLTNEAINKIRKDYGEKLLDYLSADRIVELDSDATLPLSNKGVINHGVSENERLDTRDIVRNIDEAKDNNKKLELLSQVRSEELTEVINKLSDISIMAIMKTGNSSVYSDLKLQIAKTRNLSPVGLEGTGISAHELVGYAKEYYANNPQYGSYKEYLGRFNNTQIYDAFIESDVDYELTDVFLASSLDEDTKYEALMNSKLKEQGLDKYLLTKTNKELDAIYDMFNNERSAELKSTLNEYYKEVNNFKETLKNSTLEEAKEFLNSEATQELLLRMRNDDFIEMIKENDTFEKIIKTFKIDKMYYDQVGDFEPVEPEEDSTRGRFRAKLIEVIEADANNGLLDNTEISKFVIKFSKRFSKEFLETINGNNKVFLDLVCKDKPVIASDLMDYLGLSAKEYIGKYEVNRYLNGELSLEGLVGFTLPDTVVSKELFNKMINENPLSIYYFRFISNNQNSTKLDEMINEYDKHVIFGFSKKTGLVSENFNIYNEITNIMSDGGNIFNSYNLDRVLAYIKENVKSEKLMIELVTAVANLNNNDLKRILNHEDLFEVASKKKVLSSSLMEKRLLKLLQEKSKIELRNAVIDYNFKETYYDAIYNIEELMNYQLSAGVTIDVDTLKLYRDVINSSKLNTKELLDLSDRLSKKDMVDKYATDLDNARMSMNKQLADSVLNSERIQKYKNNDLSNKYGVDVYKFDGQEFYALTKSSVHYMADDGRGRSYSINGKGAIEYFQWGENLGRNIVYEGLIPEQIIHTFPTDSATVLSGVHEVTNTSVSSGAVNKHVRTLMTPRELIRDTATYNEILVVEQGRNINMLDSNMPFLKELSLYCIDEITEEDVKLAKEKGIGIMLIDSKANKPNANTHQDILRYERMYFDNKYKTDLDLFEDFSQKTIDYDRMRELNKTIDKMDREILNSKSEQNIDTIKGSILSKITPEMSDLEKARLIYIELGKKIDYSSLYRYAIRNKESNELYESEYNKQLTVADLESDPNVICATWAQVYSEMLIEAGFDPKSLILQRLKVDAEGSNNVFNSHVALYVMLDDGSVILPDMTIPIKQADLYNVKAGNNTTGFLLFTKEQQELLSKDYELWSDYLEETGVRDTLYYPQIESLKGETPVLSKIVENTIKECGNYLYGFVLEGNQKLNNDKLAHEKTFFRSINKTNADIIARADNNIKDKLTKSDFFINEVTEEAKVMRNQSAQDFYNGFCDTEVITLSNLKEVANILDAAPSMFGIDNVNDRNIGTLQGYLRDVASQIGVDTPGSNNLAISIGLNNKTENNSLTINVQRYTDLGNGKVDKKTITSFGISVDENGNYVITSKTIADKINKLFKESDKSSISEAVSKLSEREVEALEKIGIDLSEYKYNKVNVNEYVETGLKNGTLEVIKAEKTGRISAVKGTVGEEVISWSVDEKGNPIQEKVATVSVDENGETGWIVTKLDENGKPVIDQNGNLNQWIIDDKTFKKKYELAKDNVYKPTGGVQTFVKVNDNIILNQWGSDMMIAAGGYINITNADDMYGISGRDFADTYGTVETKEETIIVNDELFESLKASDIAKILSKKGTVIFNDDASASMKIQSDPNFISKLKEYIIKNNDSWLFYKWLLENDEDGSIINSLLDEEGIKLFINSRHSQALLLAIDSKYSNTINPYESEYYNETTNKFINPLFNNEGYCRFLIETGELYDLSKYDTSKFAQYINNHFNELSDKGKANIITNLELEVFKDVINNFDFSKKELFDILLSRHINSGKYDVLQLVIDNISTLDNISVDNFIELAEKNIVIPERLLTDEFVQKTLNELYKRDDISMVRKVIKTFNNSKLDNELLRLEKNKIDNNFESIKIDDVLDYYFQDVAYDVALSISKLLNYQISHGITLSAENVKLYRDLLYFNKLSLEEKTDLINKLDGLNMVEELKSDMAKAKYEMKKEISDSVLNKDKIQKYKNQELEAKYGVEVYEIPKGEKFYLLTKSSSHNLSNDTITRSFSINDQDHLDFYHGSSYYYGLRNIAFEGLVPEQIKSIYYQDAGTSNTAKERADSVVSEELLSLKEIMDKVQSNEYSEILITEKGRNSSSEDDIYPFLNPLGVIVNNEITEKDIETARQKGLGIILVSKSDVIESSSSFTKDRDGIKDYEFESEQRIESDIISRFSFGAIDELLATPEKFATNIEVEQETTVQNEITEDGYRRVQVKDYVDEGLANGTLEVIKAKKTGKIFAERGNPGQEVISWSIDKDGNPIEEKRDTVTRDKNGNTGWVVTKLDEDGNPIVDEHGHLNQWIIDDEAFNKKYELEDFEGVYKPKGSVQTFVRVNDDIILNQWGNDEKIAKGGYINITDAKDMYGISGRDFADTYGIVEDEDIEVVDLEQKFAVKGYPKFEVIKPSVLEDNNIKLSSDQQIVYDNKSHNFVIRSVDSNGRPLLETERVIPRELLDEKNKAKRLVEVTHKDSDGVERKYWKDLITEKETPQDITYDKEHILNHDFNYGITIMGKVTPSGLHSYDKAIELFINGDIEIEGASIVINEDGTISVIGLEENSIGTYDIIYRGKYTYLDPNTGKQRTSYTPRSKQSTLYPEGTTIDEVTDIIDNFISNPDKKPYSINVIRKDVISAMYKFNCNIKGKDYIGVIEVAGDKIGTFYLKDPNYKGNPVCNTYE